MIMPPLFITRASGGVFGSFPCLASWQIVAKDLLRRFHPSREKSPVNHLPDKTYGQATSNATFETFSQP